MHTEKQTNIQTHTAYTDTHTDLHIHIQTHMLEYTLTLTCLNAHRETDTPQRRPSLITHTSATTHTNLYTYAGTGMNAPAQS